LATETAEVKGRFESIRKPFYGFLILLFLVMPWIKISGSPLIMTDIWNRHFIIFGHHFFSHDAPLLFFVIISIVFLIVLLTALFGRVWCGWACPQTVFIHMIYQKIEFYILGDYVQRQKIKNQENDLNTLFKKALVYLLFFLFSYIISHSFIAYFVGSDRILQFFQDGPEKHWVIFICIQVASVLLTINFGWFRHRLCHHICPYGRFQNVLLDSNSLGVLYMKHVGEPRRAKGVIPSEQGACIDCNRCVNVCPMKIDIRNGFQLECINCAACIDACDEIMTKVKKPTGLIQFSTADSNPINYKRFRVILYSAILTVTIGFFIFQLSNYKSVDFEISRARQSAFTVEDINLNIKVTNHFEGYLINQKGENLKVKIKLSDKSLSENFKLIIQEPEFLIEPMQKKQLHIFISKELPKILDSQESHTRDFEIEIRTDFDTTVKKFTLLGGA
jgi:cytochrome c oxidase accessory protein FixG